MYLETAGTLSDNPYELDKELQLPYGFSREEFDSFTSEARVAMTLQSDPLQRGFDSYKDIMALVSEITSLNEDSIKKANRYLTSVKNDIKYAEFVKEDDGFHYRLTSDGDRYVEAAVSKLRYGTVEQDLPA
jgi:hypothetical protein